MSLEEFREQCNNSKFYYFINSKQFDNRIDWNGNNVSKIKFNRGLVDEGKEHSPVRYSAYGEK